MKSDIASPIPVVRIFKTQNSIVISGTLAASGSMPLRMRPEARKRP